MSEDISADQIEREIEMERVALARSLNDLQRQFAPDAIVEKASSVLRENGGDIASTAMRQARENPIALALTGAGIAWLMAGPAKKTHGYREISTRQQLPKPQIDYDDRDYPSVSGFRQTVPDESFEARVARAEGDTYDPTARTYANTTSSIETKTASGGKTLRDRLMEGTEMMTEAARDRVMAAREAAILAERRIEARARDYGVAGKDAFNSQPLMGALVAFGVGALAGAILPRTQTEDRHLGAARDRALVEAERMYRSETAKLRAQAETIAEDAVTSVSNALQGSDTPASGSNPSRAGD